MERWLAESPSPPSHGLNRSPGSRGLEMSPSHGINRSHGLEMSLSSGLNRSPASHGLEMSSPSHGLNRSPPSRGLEMSSASQGHVPPPYGRAITDQSRQARGASEDGMPPSPSPPGSYHSLENFSG